MTIKKIIGCTILLSLLIGFLGTLISIMGILPATILIVGSVGFAALLYIGLTLIL